MTLGSTVPFNRVLAAGEEIRYLQAAVEGGHVSGAGPYTSRCEQALNEITGSEQTLLTTSCTHALEMACHLLDLGPGDEVVVPSFTFVSTAAAVAMRGAVPVFADIRDDTLGLDERLLDRAWSERTKAIILVHYAGVGCEMEEISQWASDRGIDLVEDNAHGLFGSYRARPLGSFGALSTLSFHETKNLSCGEGGALQINRADLVDRAEVLREKGTDRSAFLRGRVDKYRWIDLGSSWLPSDMLAAFLWAQIERRTVLQAQRQAIWAAYAHRLAPWLKERGFRTLEPPADRRHPAHLFWIMAPSPRERDRLLQHLRSLGVQAVFHYVPLHSSPAGRRLGRSPGSLDVTERVSASLLRLPLWAGMTEAMIDQVVSAVLAFR